MRLETYKTRIGPETQERVRIRDASGRIVLDISQFDWSHLIANPHRAAVEIKNG